MIGIYKTGVAPDNCKLETGDSTHIYRIKKKDKNNEKANDRAFYTFCKNYKTCVPFVYHKTKGAELPFISGDTNLTYTGSHTIDDIDLDNC
jgi:hypothetical protein